jgi:hypothetical protein
MTASPGPAGSFEQHDLASGPGGEAGVGDGQAGAVGVSVVLPCLNEAASVARCVEYALRAIRGTGLTGEVIVCDNGSTDGSAELALAAGATVVHESRRGYGSAYLRGFSAARGTFIVMGDADASYDFGEIPNLVTRLQDGYDYVVGSRFAGQILPGAMPWTHRYIGNPMLTGLLNRLFGTRLSDAHSGLRAMTRTAYDRLMLRCTGMELASEIAVRAAQTGLRAVEVPITYHPRAGASKLRPLQDGWRHLRFLVGMIPGLMTILTGTLMLVCAAAAVVAVQAGLLGTAPGLSLPLTTVFALLVLVSGQVVALGTATHLHSLSLTRDVLSHLSRSIKCALESPRLHVLGPALFVLGLAAELAGLLTAHSDQAVATAHLRFSVIALTTMMLGVQTSIVVSYLARAQAGAARMAAVPGALALAGPPPGPQPLVPRSRLAHEDGTPRHERRSP